MTKHDSSCEIRGFSTQTSCLCWERYDPMSPWVIFLVTFLLGVLLGGLFAWWMSYVEKKRDYPMGKDYLLAWALGSFSTIVFAFTIGAL